MRRIVAAVVMSAFVSLMGSTAVAQIDCADPNRCTQLTLDGSLCEWESGAFTPDVDILDVCEINPLCKSGFDFTRIVAHYDFATNRLYLGMDIQDAEGPTCERDMPGPNIIGVPGDANGDNDTTTVKADGICIPGDDQECIGVDEAYTFQIDTNVNGSFTDTVDLRVVYRNNAVTLLDGQRNPINLPGGQPWPVAVAIGMGAQLAGPTCPNASPCDDAFDIEMAIEMFDMLDTIPVCYAVRGIAQSLVDGPPEDFSDVGFSSNRPAPDVTIKKFVRNVTMGVGFDDRGVPARPGDQVEFKVDITNTGDIRLATGTVTDVLDADYINIINGSPGSCAVTGQQFQCMFTDLEVGQTVTYTYRATINPATTQTKILNTANVTATAVQEGAGCGGQTVLDNDPARVFLLDLACEKLVSVDGGQTYSTMPTNAVPGQTLFFKVVVTNPAGVEFEMITLEDMLDPQCYDMVSAVSMTCGANGNTISCSASPLPSGGSVEFIYTARLRPDVDPARTCTNTANITGFFEMIEITTSCSVDVNPLRSEVMCTKLVSLDNVNFFPSVSASPCQTVFFEVTVGNTGEADLFDIMISDMLPAEYSNVQIQPGSGSVCNASGNNVSCTITGPITSGNGRTIKYQAEFLTQVQGTNGAVVVNTANITATPGVGPTPAEQGTPVMTSCQASVTTQLPDIDCETLVSLDGTNFVQGPIDVVRGQKVFFQATVTNTGSAAFYSTLFEDSLANCFGNITIESGGAGCTPSGRTISCDFGATNPGAFQRVVYSAFAIAEDQICGNSATTTGIPGSAQNEGCFVNSNCSTTVDILNVEIECLKLSSLDGVNFFPQVAAQPGDTVFFKVVTSIPAGGEACFINVALTDMLPAEFTNVQFVSGAASCMVNGSNMITCSNINGAQPFCPGDAPIEVVYRADLTTGTLPEMLTNTATITGTPGIPGISQTGTPEDSEGCSSTVRILNLEVECAKSFDPAQVVDGQTVTFTVDVTNTSESDVTFESVVLDDTLSAGFTNIVIISSPGNDCDVNQAARTLQCRLGTLARNETKTVVYTADVSNPPINPLTNDARVTATFEDIVKESSCPRAIPVLTPCIECDKEATLSPNNTGYMDMISAIPGQRVYFRVRIKNCGDAPFFRVSLTDMLPAGFSDLRVEEGACVIINGDTISCDDLGSLPVGNDEIIVRFSGKVDEDLPPSTLQNIASVTGFPGTDDNPGETVSSNCPIPIDILEIDFECTKEVSLDGTNFFPSVEGVPGQKVFFRVKVDNTGEVPVAMTLTDDITGIYRKPETAEGVCAFNGTVLECNFDLAAGGTRTINYNAILRDTVPPGTYQNTVDLKVTTGPPENPGAEREKLANCLAEVTVVEPEIVCVKGVSLDMGGPFEQELPVVPGDHVFFQVIITNTGDADLRDVVLKDLVSDDCFENVTLIDPLPPTCETTGNQIDCNFGDLAEGGEIIVLYEADVIESTSEICRNTVEITAQTGSEMNPGAEVDTECSAVVTTIIIKIPTLSEIGFMLMVLALGGVLLLYRRRV